MEGHMSGDLWDLDLLKKQTKKVIDNQVKGSARMGVCKEPLFDIAVVQYTRAILHALIGDTSEERELDELLNDIKELQNEIVYFDEKQI